MGTLHFKKLDAEQSEVWRDDNPRHIISTAGVHLAVQQICAPDAFEQFARNYPTTIGDESMLDDINVDAIAGQLEVQ